MTWLLNSISVQHFCMYMCDMCVECKWKQTCTPFFPFTILWRIFCCFNNGCCVVWSSILWSMYSLLLLLYFWSLLHLFECVLLLTIYMVHWIESAGNNKKKKTSKMLFYCANKRYNSCKRFDCKIRCQNHREVNAFNGKSFEAVQR